MLQCGAEILSYDVVLEKALCLRYLVVGEAGQIGGRDVGVTERGQKADMTDANLRIVWMPGQESLPAFRGNGPLFRGDGTARPYFTGSCRFGPPGQDIRQDRIRNRIFCSLEQKMRL